MCPLRFTGMRSRVGVAVLLASLALLLVGGAWGRLGAAGGGTIRIIAYDEADPAYPGILDPQLTYSIQAWQLTNLTCALLLANPDDGEPTLVPEAATGFPAVSQDGRTYTFTVRRGWRFADGRPLTAANYKAALDRIRDPALKAPGAVLFADVRSVTARGQTLSVRLAAPNPDLLSRVAMPFACPIPAGLSHDPAGVPFVPATGPYAIARLTPGKEIVLVRNGRYGGRRRHVADRIVVTIGGSPADNIARVERGEGEVRWEAVNFDAEAQQLSDRYGVNKSLLRRVPSSFTFRYVFNTSGRLFRNNVSLRRAINFALDRPELLRRTFEGRAAATGLRTDQTVPIGFPGWRNHRLYPLTGPDLVTARRLARGNLRGGHAVLYYSVAFARARRSAEALAFQLGKIGLEVELRQLAPDVFYEKLATPGEPWDIAPLGWQADIIDPSNFVIPLFGGRSITGMRNWPGVNLSRLDVPEVNRKIMAAQRLSGERRWRAFVDLDAEIVRNYAPEAPYASTSWLVLVGPRLGCVRNHPMYWLALNTLCLKE